MHMWAFLQGKNQSSNISHCSDMNCHSPKFSQVGYGITKRWHSRSLGRTPTWRRSAMSLWYCISHTCLAPFNQGWTPELALWMEVSSALFSWCSTTSCTSFGSLPAREVRFHPIHNVPNPISLPIWLQFQAEARPPEIVRRSGAPVFPYQGMYCVQCWIKGSYWITVVPPLIPIWQGDPTRSSCPWQHSSQGHRDTQTPPSW